MPTDFYKIFKQGGLDPADHHASRVADLMVEHTDGKLSRQQALYWLLHTNRGQALLARMSKQTERPMPTDLRQAIAKHGVVAFCKAAVIADTTAGITEHELTAAITKYALLNKRDGETPAQAFARVFTAPDDEGEMLRRAVALAKGAAMIAPNSSALAELNKLAKALRQRQPGLTEAAAFAKVYSDPSNFELAKRERLENRPG
jgi:hypothetical protein